LIFGPSGAGKSSLALALIATAGRDGLFARLIGDDRIALDCRGGRLIARGHPAVLGKVERRGHGIFDVPFVPAAVVRLAIRFQGKKDAPPPRHPDETQAHILLEGARVSLLRLRQDVAYCDLAIAVLSDPRLR